MPFFAQFYKTLIIKALRKCKVFDKKKHFPFFAYLALFWAKTKLFLSISSQKRFAIFARIACILRKNAL